MRLIAYVFTFPQRLLMCMYPYAKNFIFISIIIYHGWRATVFVDKPEIYLLFT